MNQLRPTGKEGGEQGLRAALVLVSALVYQYCGTGPFIGPVCASLNTGPTPDTSVFGCSHMYHVVSEALKPATGTSQPTRQRKVYRSTVLCTCWYTSINTITSAVGSLCFPFTLRDGVDPPSSTVQVAGGLCCAFDVSRAVACDPTTEHRAHHRAPGGTTEHSTEPRAAHAPTAYDIFLGFAILCNITSKYVTFVFVRRGLSCSVCFECGHCFGDK